MSAAKAAEPTRPLFEQARLAARKAAAANDHATHARLHEIDILISGLWHKAGEAAKMLQGEPLALVQRLQRNL